MSVHLDGRLASAAVAGAAVLLTLAVGTAGLNAAVAMGAAAYVLCCAAVLCWAVDVYGWRPALAATAMFAIGVLPACTAYGGGVLLAVLLPTIVVHWMLRCYLDPTLQDSLTIGLIGGVAILSTPLARGVLPPVLLIAVMRVVTVQPHESRLRVGRGVAVSALLIWLTATAVYAAAPGWDPGVAVPQAGGVAVLAPAGLLVLRPWRRHRRYADGVAVAAVVCLGVAAWSVTGSLSGAGWAALAPLTILAAAVWDHGAGRRRHLAGWLVIAAQIAFVTGWWARS